MQAEQQSEREVITVASIRAAGGIVHSDGNIFFTNIDQLRAALSHPSTQGWKLVPIEPTLEMVMAGAAEGMRGGYGENIYSAMLNSAPPPPEQGGKG